MRPISFIWELICPSPGVLPTEHKLPNSPRFVTLIAWPRSATNCPLPDSGQRANLKLTAFLVSGADDCGGVGHNHFNPTVHLPPMAAAVIGNWILFTVTRCDDAATVNSQLCQSGSY